MDVTDIISSDGQQSILLPAEYHFKSDKVRIGRIGDIVLLIPTGISGANGILRSLDMFTDDFLSTDRDDALPEERDSF